MHRDSCGVGLHRVAFATEEAGLQKTIYNNLNLIASMDDIAPWNSDSDILMHTHR